MVVYSGEIFAQQHSDYFFASQHNDQTEISGGGKCKTGFHGSNVQHTAFEFQIPANGCKRR